MAPLIALLATWLGMSVVGWLGVPYLQDWQVTLRYAVAVMFLLSASGHWGKRRAGMISMVPPVFPRAALIVTVTGVLEILGAIGLVIPLLAPVAGIALAILLLAMYPANVYAARQSLTLNGKPVMALLPRTLVQVVYIAAALAAVL
jgi:uncharacterized membrane protein